MSGNKQIDWPGLFKWSMSYSDGTTEPTPMSLERMKFLEAAMKEAMDMYEDPNDIVVECVKKLEQKDLSNAESLTALHLIEKCVDEAPEISRNLHKLGALRILLQLVNHEEEELSQSSLQILAFALPNNLESQREAWSQGCLQLLLQSNKPLTPSRLGAISGLVRHAPEIEKDFLNQEGCNLLITALNESNPKVQIKAANLVRHLAEEGTLRGDMIAKSHLALGLINMLQNPNIEELGVQYSETCAESVIAVLKASRFQLSKSYSEVQQSEKERVSSDLTKIIEALQGRIAQLQGQEDSSEEIARCKEALAIALGIPKRKH